MENINNDFTEQSRNQSNFTNNVSTRESWGSMMNTLYGDLSNLYERQSLLVRSEMRDKMEDLKEATTSFTVGSCLLLVGSFCLAATAIIVLNLFVPLWASALMVTSFLLLVGGIMFWGAKRKFSLEELKPRHSLETMSEIKKTFKERIHEFKPNKLH